MPLFQTVSFNQPPSYTSAFHTQLNNSRGEHSNSGPRPAVATHPSRNTLAFYLQGTRPKETREHISNRNPANSQIKECTTVPEMSPQRRQLVSDSHGIFSSIQLIFPKGTSKELAPDGSFNEQQKHVENLSKNYESSLREFVERLSTDTADQVELTLAESCHAIWSLCELLFFSEASYGYFIADDYLLWLNTVYPTYEEDLAYLTRAEDPASEEKFWPCVMRCALRGYTPGVIKLLEKHCSVIAGEEGEEGVIALQRVLDLLKKFPRNINYNNPSDFAGAWRQWNKNCANLLEYEGLQPRDEEEWERLSNLLQVLRGDEATINHAATSFFEALGAIMLYSQPEASIEDMRAVLKRCVNQHSIGDDALEEAATAFLQGELAKGLRLAAETDLWLVVHLLDTFVKLGYGQTDDFDVAFEIWSEYFIQEYSSILIGQSGLWEIALDYLESLRSPKKLQQLHVSRIQIDTEMKGQKLLAACDKYNLHEAKKSICKVLAKRYLRLGRYGAALAYYITAGDSKRIAKVANILLDEYIEGGKMEYSAILSSLGDHVYENPRLDFLGRYQKFHDLYLEERYKEAGKLLIGLLVSHSAPKHIWPLLFLDAIPMLEGDEVILDVEDTYELMRCLEEVTLSHRRREFLNSVQRARRCSVEEVEAQLDIVRLALARNLARGMVVYDELGDALL